jgi:hypothetical protein
MPKASITFQAPLPEALLLPSLAIFFFFIAGPPGASDLVDISICADNTEIKEKIILALFAHAIPLCSPRAARTNWKQVRV